jgi:hypothetical protein
VFSVSNICGAVCVRKRRSLRYYFAISHNKTRKKKKKKKKKRKKKRKRFGGELNFSFLVFISEQGEAAARDVKRFPNMPPPLTDSSLVLTLLFFSRA